MTLTKNNKQSKDPKENPSHQCTPQRPQSDRQNQPPGNLVQDRSQPKQSDKLCAPQDKPSRMRRNLFVPSLWQIEYETTQVPFKRTQNLNRQIKDGYLQGIKQDKNNELTDIPIKLQQKLEFQEVDPSNCFNTQKEFSQKQENHQSQTHQNHEYAPLVSSNYQGSNNDTHRQRSNQFTNNNHESMLQADNTDSTIPFMDVNFITSDPRYNMIQIPDIIPSVQPNITSEQLIMTHPWSLMNPKRNQYKKNMYRFLIDQNCEINQRLVSLSNDLFAPAEQQNHQTNIQLLDVSSFTKFSEFVQALSAKNSTPFDELKRLKNQVKTPYQEMTIQKINQRCFTYKFKPQFSQSFYPQPPRTVFVQRRVGKNKRDWRKQRQTGLVKEEIEQLRSKQNTQKTHKTTSNQFFSNSSAIQPTSINSKESSKKYSQSTNSTNKITPNSKSVPQVSEFKIAEYEKPFSKKYNITIDSYEQAAWKWWLYRMDHGIKSQYSGSAYIERYQCPELSQKAIIQDLLSKNEKIRKICGNLGKTDHKICFEATSEQQGHAGDLKGLITVPLQLKLHAGYTYDYYSYRAGIVYQLVIENEHASIRFNCAIDFGKKDQVKRDLRDKLRLERNNVWIGHETLMQDAIVIFKNPTTQNVKIESDHPEHISFKFGYPTNWQIRSMEFYLTKAEKKGCCVMKTLNWKRQNRPREIPLRFKLKVLAIYVSCFFLVLLANIQIPT